MRKAVRAVVTFDLYVFQHAFHDAVRTVADARLCQRAVQNRFEGLCSGIFGKKYFAGAFGADRMGRGRPLSDTV